MSNTREAILNAAATHFSELGYDGASIRTIAATAGVDPALIRHFFGDKDTLFATVVTDRTSIFATLAESLTGERDTAGRRVTEAYLGVWEEPATRRVLLAIVRSSTTSRRAAQMLTEALGARVRAEVGVDPDVLARIALGGAQLFGIAVGRYVIGDPALVEMDLNDLVGRVAPTIQRYLSGTHL